MLDKDGYRLNVGIVLVDKNGLLFWGKLVKSSGWQFPQGGVQPYETLEETMYRELKEEVGLEKSDVKILATTKRWLRYRLPTHMRRHKQHPLCIGQKQKWFLLLLTSDDDKISLNLNEKAEFLRWHWINYWLPFKQVVYFKRDIYNKVLSEFYPIVKSKLQRQPDHAHLHKH